MIAVGSWPVPWVPYGCRGGVAGPMGPIWLPWGRGRSPGPRNAAVGVWPVAWARYGCRGGVAGPLGLFWPQGGVAGPLGPYGHRGGVAGPLDPYGRRGGGGVAGFLGPVWPLWRRGQFFGPRMAAVEVSPVTWVLYGHRGGVSIPLSFYGRRGGVAGFLRPVWPP